MSQLSPWQARHADRQHAHDPEPDLGGHVDVAVVGAGLTGLTAALLLARSGRSVTVLEARHLGAGTTGASTAKLSLLQGTRLSSISRLHPRAVVRDYVSANAEGQAWVQRFCADHGVDVQQRAAITYGVTDAGARRVRRELDVARQAGLDVEWDDEPGLPFPTSGAIRLADQLQVDPIELLEALAREGAAHGVRLVEGARVRSVTGRSPVHVTTEAGSLTAATVIVATNLPMLDRGAFFARMSPARSYGLALRTPSDHAVGAMFLSADSPSRSLRDAPSDDGGSLLLVGGAGHATGRGGSTAARLDALRSWTADWFPNSVETHAWSAQDYVPSRQLPFAGPALPGIDDVLVAGGYAKWGMTNGVAAALALTAQITGGHMEWADVFRPWAARETRGIVHSARANAEVGFEMTRGWLRPLAHLGAGSATEEGQGVLRYEGLRPPVARSTAEGVERQVSAVCTHLGGIVSWNDAERSWDCPLHGSRFDSAGEVLEGPATCGLRPR